MGQKDSKVAVSGDDENILNVSETENGVLEEESREDTISNTPASVGGRIADGSTDENRVEVRSGKDTTGRKINLGKVEELPTQKNQTETIGKQVFEPGRDKSTVNSEPGTEQDEGVPSTSFVFMNGGESQCGSLSSSLDSEISVVSVRPNLSLMVNTENDQTMDDHELRDSISESEDNQLLHESLRAEEGEDPEQRWQLEQRRLLDLLEAKDAEIAHLMRCLRAKDREIVRLRLQCGLAADAMDRWRSSDLLVLELGQEAVPASAGSVVQAILMLVTSPRAGTRHIEGLPEQWRDEAGLGPGVKCLLLLARVLAAPVKAVRNVWSRL